MLGQGSMVAGYRVERVLGAGGMGTVYLAQNPELPRLDALKVLSAELSRDSEFRARFIREADVAATLDHTNIVSVYDRGETDHGQLWIAMQFVDGTDADAAISARTMTSHRAVHIISEVAAALDYAHQRRVIHRDVKPANFLLAGAGANERVLLGDFGIARALDDNALTAAGSIMATFAYAAPEVLTGESFDGRADIYSLGCALFRLLTGSTPYPANNGPAAVVMAHLLTPPPRATEHDPRLPTAVDAVIATAMAKDPEHRFQTAAALADAARAAVDGHSPPISTQWQPVGAAAVHSFPATGQETRSWRPHTNVPPAGSQPSRRRWARTAAVGVVMTVVGLTTAWVFFGRSEQHNSAEAPASAPASTPAESAAPTTTEPVPAAALPGLLLSAKDIGTYAGIFLPAAGPVSPAAVDTPLPLTNAACASAWAPARADVYTGSGFSGIATQSISETGESIDVDQLTEAVAAFPDVDAAQQFVTQQSDRWEQCSRLELALSSPGKPPAQLTFGPVVKRADGIASMTHRSDSDPPDRQCERGMAVRSNVVIDILACGKLIRLGSELSGIVGAIGYNIAHR